MNRVKTLNRPGYSNDNPFSEALLRTCKHTPDRPNRGFATTEAARARVQGFANGYDTEHRHSAIGFMALDHRHRGEDRALLAGRHQICDLALAARPERWSGGTRNWRPGGPVGSTPSGPTPGVVAMGAPARSLMKLTAAPPWPDPPIAQRETECRRHLS